MKTLCLPTIRTSDEDPTVKIFLNKTRDWATNCADFRRNYVAYRKHARVMFKTALEPLPETQRKEDLLTEILPTTQPTEQERAGPEIWASHLSDLADRLSGNA